MDLTFKQTIALIQNADLLVGIFPIGDDPLVVNSHGWCEEGEENSDYFIGLPGCGDIYVCKSADDKAIVAKLDTSAHVDVLRINGETICFELYTRQREADLVGQLKRAGLL